MTPRAAGHGMKLRAAGGGMQRRGTPAKP